MKEIRAMVQQLKVPDVVHAVQATAIRPPASTSRGRNDGKVFISAVRARFGSGPGTTAGTWMRRD